jgi:hypothetical protein
MRIINNVIIGSKNLVFKDVSELDENTKLSFASLGILIKYSDPTSQLYIRPAYFANIVISATNSICVDLDLLTSGNNGEGLITVREMLESVGKMEQFNSLPTLSKEEFYNIG